MGLDARWGMGSRSTRQHTTPVAWGGMLSEDFGQCVGVRLLFWICSNTKSAAEPGGGSRIVTEGDISGVKCSVVLYRADCHTTPSNPGGPGRLNVNHQPAVSGATTSDTLCCTKISTANWPAALQIQKSSSKTPRERSEAPRACQSMLDAKSRQRGPTKRTPPFPTRAEPQGTTALFHNPWLDRVRCVEVPIYRPPDQKPNKKS